MIVITVGLYGHMIIANLALARSINYNNAIEFTLINYYCKTFIVQAIEGGKFCPFVCLLKFQEKTDLKKV
jgi:hypothetical protein